MRYHRDLQPQHAEQVKSLQPVWLSADLVDLVDRHGHEPGRRRGGRGNHGDARAGGNPVPERVSDWPAAPPGQRIGRAARSAEHPIGRADGGQPGRRRIAGHFHLEADAAREVGLRTRRDLARVLLERVWRVKQDRAAVSGTKPGDERLVNGDHGRAGLTRAHNRQHPGLRGNSHPLPPNSSPPWLACCTDAAAGTLLSHSDVMRSPAMYFSGVTCVYVPIRSGRRSGSCQTDGESW